MKEKVAVLHSEYIIDGVQQDLTPAQMLESVHASRQEILPEEGLDSIIDETMDPVFKALEFDGEQVQDYLKLTSAADLNECVFQAPYAASQTKCGIATSLIDTIWKSGHFRLGDLTVSAKWKWDTEKIGNLAAFYFSAEAVAEYLDALGLRLGGYDFVKAEYCKADFSTSLFRTEEEEEDLLEKLPYHSGSPTLGKSRAIPEKLDPDQDSWIIYIPFESCEPRLGGSLLADKMQASGGIPLEIGDADYFIDCYEVVRELVEDKVAISGTTVSAGGLLTALKRMCGPKTGARINLSDIINASGVSDIVRHLFAEIPGAIIQIKDLDYDYVEAELLLQDVLFFPIGHPSTVSSDIDISVSDKSGIQTILESLINSQSSEGED